MRVFLLLCALLCTTVTFAGCHSSRDEDEFEPLLSLRVNGTPINNGDTVTVVPDAVVQLAAEASTLGTITRIAWTSDAGTITAPDQLATSITDGSVPRTINCRLELDGFLGTSGVKTSVITFQIIVASTLTRLLSAVNVDGQQLQNNANFDIGGARTVFVGVTPLSGITLTSITAVPTRGAIPPFTGNSSNWGMPNTPGIDTIVYTVTGTNGTLTGTESWTVVAHVF
ncbi:MAG: hypothetical protein ABI743_10745 [bacterium]